jgi:hypothetical protein
LSTRPHMRKSQVSRSNAGVDPYVSTGNFSVTVWPGGVLRLISAGARAALGRDNGRSFGTAARPDAIELPT